MKARKYQTGDKFGKWMLINHVGGNYWFARCECGFEKNVIMSHLTSGKSKSCIACGSLQRTKHGMTGRIEYTSWVKMRGRCLNHNDDRYHQYGGRGIKICDQWKDFEVFLHDMGERPPGTSLDRIDVDGHYEPSNCRWATPKEQMRNLRCHKDKPCIAELAEKIGMNYETLRARIAREWDYNDAISTPANDKSKSLSARARNLGLPPSIILSRVNRGWSEEKALSVPVKSRSKELSDKARSAGLDPDIVCNRVRKGWTEERALSTPIRRISHK